MDFIGLVGAFPVNRSLTEHELKYRLRQKHRLDMVPGDMLAVIRMNSTFLETVDKWFAFKGVPTAAALTGLLIFMIPGGYLTLFSIGEALGLIPTNDSPGEILTSAAFVAGTLGLMIWFLVRLLRKESFKYTHYPLRFNRQTRIIHYFRTSGEVASVRWDDVFFTLARKGELWSVEGHVLANDGITVLDTFALSRTGTINSHEPDPHTGQFEYDDHVRSHWEFIRRYMEEGPREVIDRVKFCMPVADRKETLIAGFKRFILNFSSDVGIFTILMSPLFAWVAIGRQFAVLTSKIPRWPAEIDSACRVEADDPYAIVGDGDGERTPDTAAG